MSKCFRCESKEIVSISAKCSDLCFIQYPDGSEKDGYIDDSLGIGCGDYVDFSFCLHCGTIQERFNELGKS